MSEESEYVINLLKGSVSNIEAVRNEASLRIIELESNASFLSTLLHISTTRNDDFSKLSFIILKNSVCKLLSRLKTNDPNTNVDYRQLFSDIKLKLQQTIELVYEANNVIMPKEFCLLIRSVFRNEFPLNCPEFYYFFILRLKSIENSIDIKAYNLIFLLHHVFKERISMRIFKDRNVTNQMAEQFYPYLSKIWSIQFFQKWKKLELNPDLLHTEFDPIQLKFNLYLDCIILNFYSYCFRTVYKNQELLQLLSNFLQKFTILSKVLQHSNATAGSERLTVVVKNVLRMLKGFALLFEKVPYDFVFLDFSLLLDQVFDFLVHSGAGLQEFETESIKLMTTIFSSSSVNNDNYSKIYFDNVEPIPAVQSSVSPISSPKTHHKVDINNVPYYKNFEELVSLNPELKESQLEVLMERQLTFYFYKILGSRGGFLKFLDLLRTKYLRLDENTIECWNDEEVPTTAPALNLVPDLISFDLFNFTFNSIVNFSLNNFLDMNNFLEYDTFLQIYTLCFKDFYNFHCYKHFVALLESFSNIVNLLDTERSNRVLSKVSKLLVFRISRILNLWCKKPLITHETKAKILSFLIKCVSSQDPQLKVQSLVPLSNLYKNSEDENIWRELPKTQPINQLIKDLLLIATTTVPVIRTRSLELACKLCLEYDECRANFDSVLDLYCKLQSAEICEAILSAILEFTADLDWKDWDEDFDDLNYNFTKFVSGIVYNTVVVGEQGLKIVSITRYSLIDELFLAVWLSILRILPKPTSEPEKWFGQIFSLFGPFLDYISNVESLFEDTLFNKFSIQILTEYVSFLNTILHFNKDYTVMGEERIFSNRYTTFSLNKLYNLSHLNPIDVNHPVGSLLMDLMLAVLSTFGLSEQMTERYYGILDMFFKFLESCVVADLSSDKVAALGIDQKWTNFQPLKIKKESLATIKRLLPLVNKIVLSTKILNPYFMARNVQDFESWINERVLTLINAFRYARNDFVRVGYIVLVCTIMSTFPQVVYPFIKISESGSGRLNNSNAHSLKDCLFVISWFLNVLNETYYCPFEDSTTLHPEKVENFLIPHSFRFQLIKDRSLINTDAEHPKKDTIKMGVKYIKETTSRLSPDYSSLVFGDLKGLSNDIVDYIKKL
eukprot:XP_766440.1 hypothetical protein [Theileria parva strain Muguga]